MLDPSARKRLQNVLRTAVLLLCAGLLYALLCRKLHAGLPCLFHALTGWKCPGCGCTRMCLALVRGDWREAFRQNRAVLLLLPAFVYLGAARCAGYVRTGDRILHGAAKVTAYCVCAAVILFGVLRNIYGW